MGDRFDDVTVRTAYRTGWTRRFWGCGRGLRAGCGVVALVGGEDELVALVCRDCWLRWSVGTAGRAGSSRDEGGCWLPWREILRWRRGELVALAGGVGGCVRAEVSWWRWSVGTAGCVGGKRCAGSSRDGGGWGLWWGRCVGAEVSWWRWFVGLAGCFGGDCCAGAFTDGVSWLRWSVGTAGRFAADGSAGSSRDAGVGGKRCVGAEVSGCVRAGRAGRDVACGWVRWWGHYGRGGLGWVRNVIGLGRNVTFLVVGVG